jgi:hypothetical protein
MATEMFAETMDNFQHSARLIAESRSCTFEKPIVRIQKPPQYRHSNLLGTMSPFRDVILKVRSPALAFLSHPGRQYLETDYDILFFILNHT